MVAIFTVTDDTELQDQFIFRKGDTLTFDGMTVHHEYRDFLGFLGSTGSTLFVYTDETCSNGRHIPTQISPQSFLGATITQVKGMKANGNWVLLTTDRGTIKMGHERECCEWVTLIDVCGDPADLIGGTIAVFECRIGDAKGKSIPTKSRPRAPTPRQYTFYEIRTTKGDVTLRWGEPDDHDDNRYGEEISMFLLP